MRFESAPELFEVTFTFQQNSMGVGEKHFTKAHPIGGSELRGDCQINRDHVREFRVRADGLAIIEQQNWFSIRRDLDRARSNRFRKKFSFVVSLEPWTFQPDAHAV